MDGFSQQLANLQRAASRAGRDDGGSGGRSSSSGGGEAGGASRNNNNSSNSNDIRRGGEYRGNNAYSNSNQRDGGGGRSSYHGHSRGDDRYRSHRDGTRDSRNDGRDYHNRKRGRNEIDNNNHDDERYRNRDYHGGRGSYRGRGGGRGRSGGRWNPNHGNNNRRDGRSEMGGHSKEPLAELVEKVAQMYNNASKEEENTAATAGSDTITKKRRHIALLFLTIDDLPHEHIWKEWLKSASKDYLMGGKDVNDAVTDSNHEGSTSNNDAVVSVLCHAKFPERIKSPWLRQRHLLQRSGSNNDADDAKNSPRFHSRRPEWGSIEITRAMIDLLEEGLRIGSNEGVEGERNNEGQRSLHRYLSTPGDASPENDTTDGTTRDQKPSTTNTMTARNIPPVDRFVFVSESCLPVTTLKEMELALFGPRDDAESVTAAASDAGEKKANANGVNDDQSKPPLMKNVEALYNKSWINARSTPNNGYARQLQWDAIRTTDIPHNLVWKADQWLVLTRSHGEAIASLPNKYLDRRDLWPALRKCRASDEMYFPTALSILGILHRPPGVSEVDESSKKESCAGDGIRRRRITYCDWSMGAKNPASFTSVTWKDVVVKARGEGCLFARKFVLASSMRGGRKVAGVVSSANNGDGLVSAGDWTAAVLQPHITDTRHSTC